MNKRFIEMREEFKKVFNYNRAMKGIRATKWIVSIGFILLIMLLGSNKYTELTVAQNYEKKIQKYEWDIAAMKIQTDYMLSEKGMMWKGNEVVEVTKDK